MLAGGGAPWVSAEILQKSCQADLWFSQLYPIAQHHDAAAKCVQNLIFKAVFMYTWLHSGQAGCGAHMQVLLFRTQSCCRHSQDIHCSLSKELACSKGWLFLWQPKLTVLQSPQLAFSFGNPNCECFLTQPAIPSAGRSSHIPPWSPALPLGQGDINLVCRLLLKMTEFMVGHLSTRFQGMNLKDALPCLTASWERGGTAGLTVLLLALFPAPAGSRPLSYCTRDPIPHSPSIPACNRPKT